jgi:hypothetical protein
VHLRLDAGVLEHITEALLGQWLAVGPANIGELADRSCVQRGLQDGTDGQGDCDGLAALLRSEGRYAVTHVLAAEYDRVTAPHPCVQQHVQPYAFFGSERPATLVELDFVLGPDREAGAFLAF